MSTFKKIVIGLLVIIVAIPLGGFGYLYFKLNSMYDKDEAKKIQSKIENIKETNGVTNILLAGVDGNNIDKGNRSDAMMILTIDSKNNDIRLTSLARDTYVDIPGYSTEKLTHAYAYEGPSLLLQTISNNFGINIDKYAVVSFESFAKIIDIIGGVEINVIDREVSHIPGVSSPGTQTLDGKQALAYSSIRYAYSAYQRDNRQRTVIEASYNKLADSFSSDFIDVGNNILAYTKTNMSPIEIFGLAKKVIKINDSDFDQMEFPLEGHRNGHIINKQKGWVIEWEKDYNKEQLNKFIFDYQNYKKDIK
ncbi:LCP family protein [Romboutsia sp.]|uniref:LCP family protein n=1 Tax=Romboutsia sp. TaxID=1965302 RepID=UPI002C801B2E|nr:LCP family protein [Romboutsia sp.]HSQ87553.1 LCP family protein [Romboutsia sp.]